MAKQIEEKPTITFPGIGEIGLDTSQEEKQAIWEAYWLKHSGHEAYAKTVRAAMTGTKNEKKKSQPKKKKFKSGRGNR